MVGGDPGGGCPGYRASLIVERAVIGEDFVRRRIALQARFVSPKLTVAGVDDSPTVGLNRAGRIRDQAGIDISRPGLEHHGIAGSSADIGK